MPKKSFIIYGRCKKCGAKLGLGHKTGLISMVVEKTKEMLGDPDIMVHCPKCGQWVGIEDIHMEEKGKNEVKRLLEQGGIS